MKIRFYLTGNGRSPVEEFLKGVSPDVRRDFFDAASLLSQGRILAMPLSRNLSALSPGLHELRFKDKAGQVRIFYFVKKGDAIYLLHAFRKKTQEFPKKEVRLLLKRLKEI